MVGGRPVPVNDATTFMGHAVHVLWRLHDRLARMQPKLGEVIAFRNVISGIPTDSPVDEISIQALISQLGYQLIYEPACIVYNKGPLTIRDFLKQRRRIYAGHLQARDRQHYEASTMKVSPILSELIAYRDFTMGTPRQALWTLATVMLRGMRACRATSIIGASGPITSGRWWTRPRTWRRVPYKVRRICNTRSVIVFRLILEGDQGYVMSTPNVKTARQARRPVSSYR